MFELLDSLGVPRCFFFHDAASGLRAVLVIDDQTLGPAAGGVRTRAYPDLEAAVRDAAALARAMTVKCALGGLAAGGAKAVVLDHPGLDRPAAFEVLGRRVQELGGLFRTAGDLGTTEDDLRAMARATEYVHTGEADLSRAVARGLLRCVEACLAHRAAGETTVGLRVAVQGCGAIGSAVAEALADAGCSLVVADVAPGRAEAVALATGARVVPAGAVLEEDVDVLCPCAVGGVVDEATASRLRAFALVGAANNVVASEAAHAALHARGVLHVPDVVASAGAVVEGIGRTVMGLPDRAPLVDALGATAERILRLSRDQDRPTLAVARGLAAERLAQARAR